ncbi:hypothetical protein LTR62_004421 [Meristemomyces frigidus]|uniref:GPI inositol-deacylase n=1 Tax=Meristemomyces frigidus TaxID=1508187 RepID=A0AAN7TMA5_9PEZI|nr:hypothetical protein LTR62_004421 [Meristemomyces frigidus]
MRKRPSVSAGDDADGPPPPVTVSSAADAHERGLVKGGDMVKDTVRSAKATAKGSERKSGKNGALVGTIEPGVLWTQAAQPAVEQGEVNGEEDGKTGLTAMAGKHSQQRVRSRGPWSCSFLTLATTAFAIVMLATIVRSFLTLQMDPKGCAMSYMMPAFAHFSDFDTEHTRFASKYSLYLYREGGVDEDIRVKGIPVIFIPGNAGSYKQVRPIAAEAAHYFQDVLRQDAEAMGNGKRPLDFFTVDFNEELSAFHGQTLLDQAEYLNEAIAYILALYHNPHRSQREHGLPDPKSVMMIGHSMGGVVARTMLRMPNYQEHTINTIITLSAPHARAPISFDADMVAAYNDINTFWRQSYSTVDPRKNRLADVTLVSVAGGGLDTMIPSEYSSLTSLVPDTHGFTVFTSAIPQVWTGMDHLAIMWCDQFRKALVKAIFDVADVRRSSQTLPQAERIKALRKRLLTGMESVVQKAALDQEPTTYLPLEQSSTSIMPHGERLVLRKIGGEAKTRAYLMPIPLQPFVEGSKFTLLTDQSLKNGLNNGTIATLLCSASIPSTGPFGVTFNLDVDRNSAGSPRLACKNVASDISYLPASTNTSVNAFDDAPPFSYLQYDLEDLHDYQFIAVVEQTQDSTKGWLMAEFTSGAENTMVISRGHHQLLMNGLRRQLRAGRPMMTELKIPEVHSTMFAYYLHVTHHKCESHHDEAFAPFLRQYIQEPYESKYFVNTEGGNINVHGLSPYMPPPLSGKGATEGLSLQLWADPTCNSTVKLSLNVDIVGSAGKLVMRYRTVFASFPILVVAVVLRKQFKVYDTTGVFMSFSHAMDRCIRTSLPAVFTALTFLAVALSKATQGPWARRWLGGTGLAGMDDIDFTINDFMLGTSDPFFWFLVPLFGIISVGICIAANYFVLIITYLVTGMLGLARRFNTRHEDPRTQANAFAKTAPYQRLIITGVLLLMVVTVVPYQFAYVVLCIVQIVTCVRALRVALDDHSGQGYHFYNYAHSLLVLMLWILPMNMPVLAVWIHNLAVHWLTPFSTHHNLLSVLPYVLIVETMSTGSMIPRVTTRLRYITNVFTFSFALYAAVYGVTYAYRLHHMANALCAWLFVIHLSSGPLSLAKLVQYLPRTRSGGGGGGGGRRMKKRP